MPDGRLGGLSGRGTEGLSTGHGLGGGRGALEHGLAPVGSLQVRPLQGSGGSVRRNEPGGDRREMSSTG